MVHFLTHFEHNDNCCYQSSFITNCKITKPAKIIILIFIKTNIINMVVLITHTFMCSNISLYQINKLYEMMLTFAVSNKLLIAKPFWYRIIIFNLYYESRSNDFFFRKMLIFQILFTFLNWLKGFSTNWPLIAVIKLKRKKWKTMKLVRLRKLDQFEYCFLRMNNKFLFLF